MNNQTKPIKTKPSSKLTSTITLCAPSEARAVIEGYPDAHVYLGQSLHLRCTVDQATEPPLYIFWYHNSSMVQYSPSKPYVRMQKKSYNSILTITNVSWEHAGVYRCEPHLATPASITVYVSRKCGRAACGVCEVCLG